MERERERHTERLAARRVRVLHASRVRTTAIIVKLSRGQLIVVASQGV